MSVPRATESAAIVVVIVTFPRLVIAVALAVTSPTKVIVGDLLITTALAISPVSMSTLVIFWLSKSIAPAAVKAPILVTVRVSVAKVKSESSDKTPSVPANKTLPAVNPSAVMVAALKL